MQVEKRQKLEDQIRARARRLGLAMRTEDTYVSWYKRFVRFSGLRHPEEMGKEEVEAFLTDLAVTRNVASATQNQALHALLFLYGKVLEMPLEGIDASRASPRRKLPVVLSREELGRVFLRMEGTQLLMAKLIYGCGMRKMETVRLRVKDLDFAHEMVLIHDGKGKKSRAVMMPNAIKGELEEQMERVVRLHEQDQPEEGEGLAGVWMPDALDVKWPGAGKSLQWQWFFPSKKLSRDPRMPAVERRHHVHENSITTVLSRAAKGAGLTKSVGAHTLRHSFATHLLLDGVDIRVIQELLGHADVKTTMVYKHAAKALRPAAVSPLDKMGG